MSPKVYNTLSRFYFNIVRRDIRILYQSQFRMTKYRKIYLKIENATSSSRKGQVLQYFYARGVAYTRNYNT